MKITKVEAKAIRAPYGEMKEFWSEGFWMTASDPTGIGTSTDKYASEWKTRTRKRPVYADHIETTIVRIYTNKGISGIGQCHSPGFPQVSKQIIEVVLTPILVGEDPLRTEYLWEKMFGMMRQRGHVSGFIMEAISGVDIALWDIKGKACGKPITALLGGPFRETLEVYQSHIPIHNSEFLKSQVQKALDLGYRALQITLSDNIQNNLDNLTIVREIAGPQIKIMVDAGAALDYRQALKLGRAFEELDILFFEEPLPAENLEGYTSLRKALDVSIAGGEGRCTRFVFKRIFEYGALDIVQPDIGRAGGISECKKIATLADAFHVSYAPHISSDSAIQTAASLHLASAIPNFLIFEHWSGKNPLGNEILLEPILFENGRVRVPDRPGLGIRVNFDALDQYVIE